MHLFLILVALVLVGFPACQKSDDDDDEGSDNRKPKWLVVPVNQTIAVGDVYSK